MKYNEGEIIGPKAGKRYRDEAQSHYEKDMFIEDM